MKTLRNHRDNPLFEGAGSVFRKAPGRFLVAVLLAAALTHRLFGAPGAAPAPVETDAAFFDLLDLARPELARVRVLAGRGDFEAARSALRDQFRDRRVRGGFWPVDPRSAQDADAIVRHEFSFYGSKPFPAGTPIRWNDRFLDDAELTFVLNRHQHLSVLAAAYRRTRDAKYARAFVEQVRDWIAQNSAPQDRGWAAWRNLEVATRLGVWSDAFFQFLPASEFTPDDQVVLLRSLHEQARWLAPQVAPGRGQWGHSLATGLAVVGLLFPEFRQAAPWRDRGYEVLAKDLQEAVYADGSVKELSPDHHNATLTTHWLPLKLAVENRYEVSPLYRETLERMAAYQAYLRRPDGRYPAFNASDSQDCGGVLAAASRFFGRPDFTYILSHGHSGSAPTSTSLAFHESGVYVLRDAWSAEANYLALDAGPYGVALQQEDKLGFELAAYGRTVLVDPGRYSFNPGDAVTAYLATTAAHNTLTVDGFGQMRQAFSASWAPAGNPANCWVSRSAFDYFAGVYSEGFQNLRDVKHFRRVFFVKDSRRPYWIISDRVTGHGGHRLTSRFQFVPGAAVRQGALAFITQSDKGNLALCPPDEAADSWSVSILTGSRDPVGGWVSPAYGKVEPAPQLIYDFSTTLPATMECVLVPFRGEAAAPKVRMRPAAGPGEAADVTALEIDFGEFRDTVLVAHDLQETKRELEGQRSNGCFVVIRALAGGSAKTLIDADAGDARPPINGDR